MRKLFNQRWTLIGIGIILFLSACCVGISIYKITIWNENDDCHARLAEEYHVDPTFTSIGNALLEQVRPKLIRGISQNETHSILSQIAPISSVDQGRTIDNEIEELVFIKVCRYPENSFTYLITYSSEGLLIDIKLFWDD